jgi:D-alanyl-D-alanine dipeptidase
MWTGFAFFLSRTAISQDSDPIHNPFVVVEPEKELMQISDFEQRLIQEGLVNVHTLDPSLMVDLKYAKTDNFMGVNVYGDFTRAYLRLKPALKLVRANQILRENYPNLRILVADALRPRSVQHMMWNRVVGTPQQPYIANPTSGSIHNFGAAVDVTLYNVETKQQLDMGTPLDHFGPLAQPVLETKFFKKGKLSEAQLKNRLILRKVMIDAGWYPLNIEWWHFDAFSRDYIRKNYSIIE